MAKIPFCAPRPGDSALAADGCVGARCAIHRLAHCEHALFDDFHAEDGKNFA
jgi:hypothetical protein